MNVPQRIRWLLIVEAAAFAGVLFVTWLRGQQSSPNLFRFDQPPIGIILNAQVLLLAIWAALSGGSIDVRLAIASIGAALLLWAPCFLARLDDLWWLPVIYVGGMFTAPLLLWLRKRVWRVACYPPHAIPAAPPWQFSMRLMFVAVTMAAVVFACRPLLIGLSAPRNMLSIIGAVITHVLQATVTVWAVLRAGRPWERIGLVLVAVVVVPALYLDVGRFDVPPVMAIALVEEMLLIVPLFLVRTLGVRLELQPRIAELPGAAP